MTGLLRSGEVKNINFSRANKKRRYERRFAIGNCAEAKF